MEITTNFYRIRERQFGSDIPRTLPGVAFDAQGIYDKLKETVDFNHFSIADLQTGDGTIYTIDHLQSYQTYSGSTAERLVEENVDMSRELTDLYNQDDFIQSVNQLTESHARLER